MDAQDRTQRDKLRTRPGMAGNMVLATVAFARAHGVSTEAIETATRLSLSEISAPDARLPNDAIAQVWRLLVRAKPGRPLPLEMARATPPSYFGPLAWGVHYAPTVRDALQTFRRYQGVLSDALQMDLEESGDEARMLIAHPADAIDGGAAAHVGLALGHRFGADVLRTPNGVVRIELTEDPFGAEAAYLDFFGVPVVRAERRALVFARSHLDEPLPTQDQALFTTILEHLQLAAKRVALPDALQPVRDAIAANANRGEYSAKALAKRMGVSLRVLQRRVSANGATLSALLDTARRANAEALLSDVQLSVEEVGFMLGYSEERAFRRAFKRLSGMSPAEWRRHRR
ncbi:MAG: AraC family transcriptional regulator ligand-binding domain-containing protein [Proteobacteria bacterium]|nr:AraC family transcriptional regulator ligand-binding domain-containing protein [Pseudomonadota bacterium]